MSRPDRVLSLLGLAMKAGKVVSGETSTESAVKSLQAYLVVVAEDASENTRKHFTDMCNYRDIPIVTYSTREELGRAIGKDYRSNLAVTDEGLSGSIIKAMETLNKEEDKI
ncbi:MAG: ribosomal L7Ae/L30e/S12e/Gadd45 family protein [Lachnospiraceae bacterium]|nr:ribosomal L7Ae/L30e/S12e/Gadd45 family protein [Lachnospiraceae bacterium]